jgi:hypothetical protein
LSAWLRTQQVEQVAMESTGIGIVTIDAMGTHTPIARQIVERSGDDVLALKDNQEWLSAEASEQGRCHGAQRTLVAQRVGGLAAG